MKQNKFYLNQFQIKIDQINPKWKGTIILGVVGTSPTAVQFPSSAILLRRPCWVATHDYVNINGVKYQSKYADCLDDIRQDTVITMTHTFSGSLTITVGQTNLEELATGLPHHVYPIFDLYGKCEKISILNCEPRNGSPINEEASVPTQYTIGGTGVVAGASGTSAVAGCSNADAIELDRNIPQCEKADLEVHEKETDISLPSSSDLAMGASGSSVM